MKKSTLWKRVGDFVMGKGFYIVLFLCVATIGISGYYLVSVFTQGEQEPTRSVTGSASMVLSAADPGPDMPDVEEPVVSQVSGSASIGQPDQSHGQQSQGVSQPHSSAAVTLPGEDESAVGTTAQEPSVQVDAPIFTWPVAGEVIRDFSLEVLAYDETMGDWRTHSGVDIAAEPGGRVQAMSAGTVEQVYRDDLMGTTVVIDHGDGLVSRCANLAEEVLVKQGDRVTAGTVIGAVGQTAIAESNRPAHLHFEVLQDGETIDPVDFLPEMK